MSDESRPKLPMWALMLDIVGTLFLAAGLFLEFGGTDMLASAPDSLRAMAIVLIVLGIFLMVPLVVVLVKRATAAK